MTEPTHRDPAGAPPAGDYLPELDGVRAVAFLLVLVYHLPLSLLRATGVQVVAWFDTGSFGVELFFVLSGFVVTRVLMLDLARGEPLRGFYLRRVLRIFPIYYLTLLVVWLVDPIPVMGWCAVYLVNYREIAGDNFGYLGHLWSLSIEEHFYLVWPALLLLGGVRRGPLLVFAVLLPVSTIATAWYFAYHDGSLTMALSAATTTRLRGLAIGALFAFWERGIRARPRRAVAVAAVMALLTLPCTEWFLVLTHIAHAVLASGMERPERLLPTLHLLGCSLLAGAIVLAVIATTGSGAWYAVLLRSRPLRWIGSISYGLYLYHLPVQFAFGRARQDQPTLAAGSIALVAIATTFVVAAASFRFVERPLIRFGRRGRERGAVPPAAAQ